MAPLTLDALLRSLKKGASPSGALDLAYLLYGDEDVLKDEAIRALLDAAVPEGRDFNVDTRYALDLTPESLDALVNTPPMLAERRAVVIRGVEQLGKRKTKLRDELMGYLASPNPSTLLILVVAAGEDPDPELVRHSTAVRLDPLSAERVPRWVQHRATQLGLTLESDAAALLLNAVGSDLGALSRELEKLASLTGDTQRPATVTDVTGLVGVRRGETVRSEEHTSELQSLAYLVCRLLLEKKKKTNGNCAKDESHLNGSLDTQLQLHLLELESA